MKILIGADPEVFVRNPNSKEFRSGYGMIAGTKEAPYKVHKGAVQVDGMALEFNIDPAETVDQFYENITTVRNQMQKMVPGYELAAVPVADFSEQVLKEQPKEALELGCEPDWCAWTGAFNPRPDGTVNFRSGAGHIHIGFTEGVDVRSENHMADCVAVVKQLDYYLGVPSLLWDSDNRRRSLYGKAGAFRPKSYGVEYRTLSNAWLNDDRLIKWVYLAAVQGVRDLENGKSAFQKYGNLAQTIIDNNQTDWWHHHSLELGIGRPPGIGNQVRFG